MKKAKLIIPILAMAFAVVGAFATNKGGMEETGGTVIGHYEDDEQLCNAQIVCGTMGVTCLSIDGFPAYMNGGTTCSIRLGRPW